MRVNLRSSFLPLPVMFAVLVAAACGGSTEGTEDLDAGGGGHTSGSTTGSKSSGATTASGVSGSSTSTSGATTGPSTSASATTSSSGASTTATTGTGSTTCNTLTPTEKAALACAMGAQPTFTGGAIASGNYNVSKVEIYPPDGGTDICGLIGLATVKGAAAVTGTQLQLVVNVTGPVTKSITVDGSYTEHGDSLTVTPTCGASSSSAEMVAYTATATTLVIDAQIMGYTGLVTLDLAP